MESELIIEFLRNALRQKRLEDRLINQAIADLRSTLAAVERILLSSTALAIGPARQRSIEAVAAAVARNVQQTWGIPQLASLQQALEPFIEQQLEFGRRVVELAGGTLSAPGTANLAAAQAVNNAVIGGKTLAETLTTSFPALVADRVERYLRLGLQQAAGEVEIIGYKDAVVAVSERNVTAIIRTGVQEVASAAQQAIYAVESDPAWLEGRLTWTAVLDSAVCPVCIGLDGREFELGQPGPYFDGRNRVSPHPQCVLADTRVIAGTTAAAVRSKYSGNVVTISTKQGRRLSVTEHHPVLTLTGWKEAKRLTESDQLICHGLPWVKAAVNPNLNQRPATAEQLFTLAAHQPAVKRCAVPPTPMDFHGDGTGLNAQIDIACVNSNLLLHGQSPCPQHVGQALFIGADVGLTEVSGLGPLDAFLFGVHATATGLVSASDLVQALFSGELTPLQALRLALIARCDPCFDEPIAHTAASNAEVLSDLVFAHAAQIQAGDHGRVGVGLGPDLDACLDQPGAYGLKAATHRLGDLIEAMPGLVKLDDVSSVQIELRHDVPVYDFSTLSGAYLAEGILVHNCRCYLLPSKWREETMQPPDGGKPQPVARPAEGDTGEQTVSFRKTVNQWLRDNPETTKEIFGKRLGSRLLDREDKLDLPSAIRLWQAPKGS